MQTRRAPARAEMTRPVRVRPQPASLEHTVRAPVAPGRMPEAVAEPRPFVPVPPAPLRIPGHRPARRPAVHARTSLRRVGLWLAAGTLLLAVAACAALTLGLGIIYSGGILPGVEAAGVVVGAMSAPEAASVLAAHWQTVRLRDGQRLWSLPASELGIILDSTATAAAAYDVGRGHLSGMLAGILGTAEVPPVLNVDFAALEAALSARQPEFDIAPVNAGVRVNAGRVEPTPPQDGRALDLAATVEQLRRDPAVLADGLLELVMAPVAPAVTDSTPLLEAAGRLLASPLTVRAYDPVTGNSAYWSAPPEQWGNWLAAAPDPSSPLGLALNLNPAPLRDFLTAQSAVFDSVRHLNMDEALAAVQTAVSSGRTDPWVRVYHRDRPYVVQPGETITSIAWDVGVPYLFIQGANNGLSAVYPGQTITIPSPDTFLEYPVVPDKRIIVSISRQRVIVYENGNVKWDWPASTGISDSPTWPGIYQIISHEPNAYAGNWNLWMPNFMGVYRPIPGADFTNGFHGFPTRGGSQLLWTNSLGTRVTYGCILISNDNSRLLYDWAQEGVVVEIQP